MRHVRYVHFCNSVKQWKCMVTNYRNEYVVSADYRPMWSLSIHSDGQLCQEWIQRKVAGSNFAFNYFLSYFTSTSHFCDRRQNQNGSPNANRIRLRQPIMNWIELNGFILKYITKYIWSSWSQERLICKTQEEHSQTNLHVINNGTLGWCTVPFGWKVNSKIKLLQSKYLENKLT